MHIYKLTSATYYLQFWDNDKTKAETIKKILENYDLSGFETFVRKHTLYIKLNDISEFAKKIKKDIIYYVKDNTICIYDDYVE